MNPGEAQRSRAASALWRRGRRVLLADNDAQLRSLLREVFELDGWDVREISDGLELASWLLPWWLEGPAEPPADLLISDLWMPGLTGREVIEGLADTGKRLPTILTSAATASDMGSAARRCGALAFFAKPFNVEELREVALNVRAHASLVESCPPTLRSVPEEELY